LKGINIKKKQKIQFVLKKKKKICVLSKKKRLQNKKSGNVRQKLRRELIIHRTTEFVFYYFLFEVLSSGFPKFFNAGEKPDAYPNPDKYKDWTIGTKIDGSLMNVDFVNDIFYFVKTTG
jgi:hypothetical protein